MKTKMCKTNLLLLNCIIVLSACVPIIRTEYLSPSWQGTLIDSKTGAPLMGVAVTDLYTQVTVKTDQQGFFKLAPETSQFSFKLPVASMASFYQIEIALAETKLRFSGHRLAVNTEPSQFKLGRFAIEKSSDSHHFLLEDNGKNVQLPVTFVELCGAPIQDAISISQAARLYKELSQGSQPLGANTVTNKDVDLTYQWAKEAWGYASEVCFRHDYERSVAFSTFFDLFYEEAQAYTLNDIR